MTEKIRHLCPLCQSIGMLIHRGVRDNKDIDVYECQHCKIKFLSSIQDINYKDGGMHKSNQKEKLTVEQHLAQCEPDDERRYKMVSKWCKDKNVLDFGCGYGGFLRKLSECTKSLVGVELGSEERKYINSIGITCFENIDEIITEKIDVITIFHVLEHLDNPQEYLDKFANKLKSGGIIIIEVPNANDALLSLYRCEAFADFTYWSAHLILYTEDALIKLMQKTGKFKPLDIGFFQRYSLANHLFWLSQGKPGGQKEWDFFNNPILEEKYVDILKSRKECDTIFQIWQKI